MWKIILTLTNGMTCVLNDVRTGKPGWAECQPSGIEKFEFSFEGKDEDTGKKNTYHLLLAGMKEYNFFVEAIRSISGGGTQIINMWFLGKIPETGDVVGFILGNKITSLRTSEGKEYNGLPTIGWKRGVIGGKIIYLVSRG